MLYEQIRHLRTAQGITQVEMARRLGVSKQSVSNWENNNIQPSVELLERLADFFAVSTDCLLSRDESQSIDVSGLGAEEIAHLRQLVNDLKKRMGPADPAKSGRESGSF